MAHPYLYSELLVYMLCKVLCAVYAAVLSSSAPKREHQRRESSLHIPADVRIGKLVHTVKECQYLTIVLKETYHRLVKSREFLIWLISPWVVGTAAVKDISSAITALILWYTLSEREAEHPHYKRSLSVVFRECCRAVHGICTINVAVCSLVTTVSYTHLTLPTILRV